MIDNRLHCWACGKLIKPVDKFGDTCNRCALAKADPKRVLSDPKEDDDGSKGKCTNID